MTSNLIIHREFGFNLLLLPMMCVFNNISFVHNFMVLKQSLTTGTLNHHLRTKNKNLRLII